MQTNLTDLTDKQLVEECKRGFRKRRHWEVLVSRHEDYVIKIVKKRLDDRELVKDTVQDTFLKAFKGLKGFRGDSNFRTWLSRIAENNCASSGRNVTRNRQRFPFSVDDKNYNTGGFSEKNEKDPLEQLLQKERNMTVTSELTGLSNVDRRIFTLLSEGYSYKEIAAITGVPQGTVGSRIYSIKMKIREKLKKIGLL